MASKCHPLMMKHAKGSIKARPLPAARRDTAGFAQPAGCGGWLCKVDACVANSRLAPPRTGEATAWLAAREA
ncbi:MAG: hypothetical protein RugAbin2_01071 [Rugosibacter sp.]|nr:hypothetical protein [Rugosibacter sp.]